MSTYIIAEAGVNHNGSLDLAKVLIDIAKEAGADAVKFQTFKAENLVTKDAKQATYQEQNMGQETSQYDMLKQLELSHEAFFELKQYCDKKEIDFLSTPFDEESAQFLVEDLKMTSIKIPSGELTNSPFIYELAKYRKPMILSTGMATLDEIEEALGFIAYGLANKQYVTKENSKQFYQTQVAKDLLKEYVTLLHCTTTYPTPNEEVNLNAITTLQENYNISVGFSDHSQGIMASIGAVGLGATVIEKHFTISTGLSGPDHKASLVPSELITLVKQIRLMEQLLGTVFKEPTQTELANKLAARKSIVAKRAIKKGECLTVNNITVKRPGNGIAPSEWWRLLGTEAVADFEEDTLIYE